VFKAAILAADMSLCAECVALILDELPVGAGDDSEPRLAAAAKVSDAAAPGRAPRAAGSGAAAVAAKKASAGKPPGAATTSVKRPAGSAGKKNAAGAGAGAGDAVSPLERDIKDIADLLRSFMSRVMASAAPTA
jgi:hypothetical protein